MSGREDDQNWERNHQQNSTGSATQSEHGNSRPPQLNQTIEGPHSNVTHVRRKYAVGAVHVDLSNDQQQSVVSDINRLPAQHGPSKSPTKIKKSLIMYEMRPGNDFKILRNPQHFNGEPKVDTPKRNIGKSASHVSLSSVGKGNRSPAASDSDSDMVIVGYEDELAFVGSGFEQMKDQEEGE